MPSDAKACEIPIRAFPDGVAKLELLEIERAVKDLDGALSSGSENAIRKQESRLEAAGMAVAKLVGANGWEWMEWAFSGESDAGQASTAYVAAGGGRHPGLGAARSGSAGQLAILLERGYPIEIQFHRSAPQDLARLAARERTVGAWSLLEPKILDLSRKNLSDGRQHLLGWLSGCAEICWARGILECEDAFRKLYPNKKSDLYARAAFGSPMESLLYRGGANEPPGGRETLQSLLRLAPEDSWPMEREQEGSPERFAVYGTADGHSLFIEAFQAGAWWAMEDLFVPKRDGDWRRIASETQAAIAWRAWEEFPEAGVKAVAMWERLGMEAECPLEGRGNEKKPL